MKDKVRPPKLDTENKVQAGEVRNIGWFSFDESIILLRPYDIAKKNVLTYVYNDIRKMKFQFNCSSAYNSNQTNFHWKLCKTLKENNDNKVISSIYDRYEGLRLKYLGSSEYLIDSSDAN